MIPILDAAAEMSVIWAEVGPAVEAVLLSGNYIGGPNVRDFEAEAAAFLGVRHAVALNSGTDALLIGLEAMGVGPGDEVVTTPFTFYATAEAVQRLGAIPVFADIAPSGFSIDPASVEARITPRTRAIIPVHLFGAPAPMGPLLEVARRHGLPILEDVAQAFGARAEGRRLGALGACGAFSFFPTKNLGACGDGGMLATDDAALAERARMLRSHGSREKYRNEMPGYNSRLDEVQAAVLRIKLRRVDEWNGLRRAAAARYGELLGSTPGLVLPDAGGPEPSVFHQYTLRVLDGRRDAVKEALAAEGVATMVYYPVPLHLLPVFSDRRESHPASEKAAREVLSLPIWPTISPEVQGRVAAAVKRALGAR